MAEKWDKKKIAEYAEQLKSPFDEVGPDGQKSGVAGAVERIRRMIAKKKEIK